MGCDVALKVTRGTAVVCGSPFWGKVGMHHALGPWELTRVGYSRAFQEGPAWHGDASIEVLADMVSQPLPSGRISARIWPGGGISLSCNSCFFFFFFLPQW